MNKTQIAVSAVILPALVAGCGQNDTSKDVVIEAPQVEVENGMVTPEVLEAFGRVGNPALSPDGKTIAFTIGYESIELDKSNSEIYIINADGTDMKRLTKTPRSESNLQWIENGERLAFLGYDEETENMQVFAMKPDGSGRTRLSKMENGVECFVMSPDGKRVVMGSPVKDYNQNDSTLFAGLDKTTGRLVDDLMYKHWDEWVDAIPHPFVAEFDGNKIDNAEDIMAGEPFECPMRPFGGTDAFTWSPDGKQLIYVSRKLRGMDYAFSTDSNLFLYDVEKKSTRRLTDGPGYDTDPAFSPDGKQIAWLSMPTAKYESDKKRLMVMDARGNNKRDLTEAWDYWPEQITWDGNKSIVFCGYHQGTEAAFRMDVATCRIDTLAHDQFDYESPMPAKDGVVYALRHNMMRPNELCMIKGGKVTEISKVNSELLAKIKPGKVEKHWVPTTDGKQMLAWVILPPDFDANKKYPALLYCQGGPQQAVSQFWSYRWNFLIMASQGYVVIAPCRRGTPGFGTEWNRQISGDYGGQNMRDYISARDYIASQSYVDDKHIGAIGASYGGFSVYWLAGHNNGKFQALIAHAGIFNIEAQYLETEEMWFADFDLGGPYWDKNNETAQRSYANSPHLFVDQWEAPMLITVGEKDYRILASQGMMAFNAAKMHGLEAEMLVFPDENHWVVKPQNAVLWQRTFFRFLDRYLKNPVKSSAEADTTPALDSTAADSSK